MISLEKVLAAAMRHKEVTDTLGEALISDLVVAHPYYRTIMQFVVGFTQEHRSLPKHGDIEVWTTTLPDTQRHGVLEALSRIGTQDIRDYTPEFLASHVIDELRQVATRTAITRLASATAVTPELLHTLSEQVKAIEPTNIAGLADIRDVERWVQFEEGDDTITTGIQKLDQYIGGFRKGEFILLFADSGVGKTTSLCNHGMAAAVHGSNVLHVTLELNTRGTLHRYYRRIAEADRVFFRTETSEVIKRTKHWSSYAKGNVHVLEQPAYELEPGQLHTIVDRYAQLHGSVDMIILDYIDLLAAPKHIRGKSTADQMAQISHMVRALTKEYECCVLTATQAVRKAHGAKRLTMADVADSYGKVRAADILIGLVQDEQEEAEHQARYCLLKLRDSAGRGMEIPLYINHDLARISDVDHPDTVRIMKQLGHLPGMRKAA